MIKQFFDFYDYYADVCAENTNKDGQQMTVNDRDVLKKRMMICLGSIR